MYIRACYLTIIGNAINLLTEWLAMEELGKGAMAIEGTDGIMVVVAWRSSDNRLHPRAP